jgi:basic membrane lipoprotein Med (substrate-binding protein (PBP1-ABC) superfamily)
MDRIGETNPYILEQKQKEHYELTQQRLKNGGLTDAEKRWEDAYAKAVKAIQKGKLEKDLASTLLKAIS